MKENWRNNKIATKSSLLVGQYGESNIQLIGFLHADSIRVFSSEVPTFLVNDALSVLVIFSWHAWGPKKYLTSLLIKYLGPNNSKYLCTKNLTPTGHYASFQTLKLYYNRYYHSHFLFHANFHDFLKNPSTAKNSVKRYHIIEGM